MRRERGPDPLDLILFACFEQIGIASVIESQKSKKANEQL